jgi:hypothetical protein
LSALEEVKIAGHLKLMASYGYRYTRPEVANLASDFALQLGKRDATHPLTLKRFRGFMERWPELRVLKPRSLEQVRAKAASETVVDKYFIELHTKMVKYGFEKLPHLIFNVDEKGITQDHTPPSVVCGGQQHPQSVTSGKSNTTTVLGCGSDSGVGGYTTILHICGQEDDARADEGSIAWSGSPDERVWLVQLGHISRLLG